jgi:hypothetical protein
LFARSKNLFTDAELGDKILVYGRYLPAGWKTYPRIIHLAICLAVIVWRYPAYQDFWYWLVAVPFILLVLWPIYFALLAGWFFFFRKRLEIVVSRDDVAIGKSVYSRRDPIDFAVAPHKLTASNKKRDSDFRNALEVLMGHGYRPVTIAEMRGRDVEAAHDLVGLLKNALRRTAGDTGSSDSQPVTWPAPDVSYLGRV